MTVASMVDSMVVLMVAKMADPKDMMMGRWMVDKMAVCLVGVTVCQSVVLMEKMMERMSEEMSAQMTAYLMAVLLVVRTE